MRAEPQSLAALALAFPWINWREPVSIMFTDGIRRYACRVCVAQRGLIGSQVPSLPTDPEEVRAHFASAHRSDA